MLKMTKALWRFLHRADQHQLVVLQMTAVEERREDEPDQAALVFHVKHAQLETPFLIKLDVEINDELLHFGQQIVLMFEQASEPPAF